MAKPADNKSVTLKELGSDSQILTGGIIINREYNDKLKGQKWMKVADEMRFGDATVKASMNAIKLPIQSARWRIQSASDKREDKKIAEFIEDCLFNWGTKTWAETLKEILLYLDYGVMPFEIVYEFREDQTIGLKKLASRFPGSIHEWQTETGGEGVTQHTADGTFSIPMEKMVVFVNDKEGENWWGISILRSAYKHWYTKDKLYLIDAISAERQGMGIPTATAPINANEDDRDRMEQFLKNLRTNEKAYGIVEDGWIIEMMDMKSGGIKNVMPSIQHHDRAITLNVLAQFLMLGGTSVGSFALSADQSKLFILSLESVANHIKDVVNRYLIKKLVDLNFNDVYDYPTLEVEKIGSVDSNILTTSLQRGYQTGFLTPQPDDEKYVRDAMDLPDFNGQMPVDEHLADDMINELQNSMGELNGQMGDGGQDQVEDPNNPGFDMDGNPMEQPTPQTANWTDLEYRTAAFEVNYYIAGPAGQPLSEETKRKISEALKKNGTKGKGKGKAKKAVNPEIAKKQKEISSLQKEVTKFSNDARLQLLEKKAKGEKMSAEDSAKFQLDLFKKMTPIKDKITALKDQVTQIKQSQATPAPTPKKASEELLSTIERVNSLIDADEK